MKKNNLKILILLLFTIIITSCSSENDESTITKEQKKVVSNTEYYSKMPSSDTLFFEISKNQYLITYSTKISNNLLTSSLSVSKNNRTLFDISYDFDTKKEHWKLYQSDKVVEKAIQLKNDQINIEVLYDVNNLIEEYIPYIRSKTIDNKNQIVVSSINYHKSIINTTIRSFENSGDCYCTTHPEFLIDKSFFNCQEDHFYNVSELKSILDQYVSENTEIDSSTEELIAFLATYKEKTINFNKYYSFYISNKDFQTFITNQKTDTITTSQKAESSGDCALYCLLGCGSDHGCCGNYSGCCLYWNIGCYIHDKTCPACEPEWWCFPGCVPDAPQPEVDSITMY